jgi:hypothetical protein
MLILVSLLLLIFVWLLPLQTQDGPNHRKVAVILERLDRSPVEGRTYESQLGPLKTNSLFSLLYLPASTIMSSQTYEKLFFGFFTLTLQKRAG